LDKALQAKNIGRLIYCHPKEDLEKKIYEQAVDGFHQIGTLRMGTDESAGVTDSFGRLFGTRNGFVASTAIFPTSGQANPTLTLVALTVRQAKYIAQLMSNKESFRA
jgi:choline dehydrogenase-like flavoprotein